MVAVNTNKNNIYLARENSAEVTKVESTKQLKRIEEQEIRKAKKNAKRHAKAVLKERHAIEKEIKQDDRDRKAEEEELMNQGLSGKEMEEQKRQMEEDVLFQEYLKEEPKRTVNHTKKSAFDSNRLGGSSMA